MTKTDAMQILKCRTQLELSQRLDRSHIAIRKWPSDGPLPEYAQTLVKAALYDMASATKAGRPKRGRA